MAFWRINRTPYFLADKGNTGGETMENESLEGEELEEEELSEGEGLEDEELGDEELQGDELEDDKVPLAVLLKEKAKRKELEKKLKERELQEEEEEQSKEKERIKQRYLKAGYDPEFAEIQADEQVRQKSELRKIKEDLETREFRAELKEVAQSDTFFKDAPLFEKEIREKMKSVKGITIEEAYMLVRGGARRKEFQTDVEQRQAAARRSAIQKGGTANTGGGSMTSRYKLDTHDKKALAQLQKAMPDAKWTPEKYYKMIKRKE